METNTRKPQYISYVRYAKTEELEETKQESAVTGKVIYYGLLAYSIALLFTPAWMLGLPIVGTVATINGVHKALEYKNTPRENKLVVNRYF